MLQQSKKINATIRTKIITLSVYFIFLISASISFNNVVIYMHEKYQHENFGQSYLTANSLSMIVSFLIAPYLLRKISIKKHNLLIILSLTISLTFLVPTIFSISELSINDKHLPPPTMLRYICEIVANLVCGFSLGFTAILQGIILAQITQPAMENKGKYFAMYNLIGSSKNIISPLLTMLALGNGNQTIYYFSLFLTVMISAMIAKLYLVKIYEDSHIQAEPAIINQKQCCHDLLKCSVTMKNFIGPMIYFGLMMGLVSSSLSHLLPKSRVPGLNDRNVGITLFCFGVGSIIGGTTGGIVYDKLKCKKTGNIGFLLFIISLVVQLYCIYTRHSLTGACVVAFFLGLALNFTNCFFMLVITIYFNAKAQAFAIYRLLRLTFYTMYPWIAASISSRYQMNQSMTYQSVIFIVIGIAFAIYMSKFESHLIHIQFEEFQNQQLATQTYTNKSQGISQSQTLEQSNNK